MHTPSRAQKQNKTKQNKSSYELFKYSKLMHKYYFHAALLEITLMKTQTTTSAPKADVFNQQDTGSWNKKEEWQPVK